MRRALIVGAGIAGLASAVALLRTGWDVEVVERAAGPAEAGAGIYLPGNATRVLGRLGLADAVRDRAAVIQRQRFLDHRGRVLADVDVGSFWAGCGPCLALPRSDLHRVLLDGCGLSIRYGTTVTDLDEHDGTATLSDGDSRRVELIVGADGSHSGVRAMLGGTARPEPVGYLSWRFVVDDLPDFTDWTVLLGRGCTFLLVSLGRGRVYCYADVSGARRMARADGAPWQASFAGFAAPVPAALAGILSTTAVYSAQIMEVVAAPTVRGRVVLVGDAAHATSPNMAQGAAMACEDALVLADELTGDQPVPAALAAFARRRARRTDWVRDQTHRRDRARELPGPVRAGLLRFAGDRMYRSSYRPLLTMP